MPGKKLNKSVKAWCCILWNLILIGFVWGLILNPQAIMAKGKDIRYAFNVNEEFGNIFIVAEDHYYSANHANNNHMLVYAERLECQRAIEKVYWQYRIWPKENPQPKPPFEKIMTEDALRARVEDVLRKTNALEFYWHESITAEQLQQEIQRMAQNTKRPEMLQDLWNALNNDPHLIAECLARPILVDKIIRNSYGYDTAIHGELKNRAQTDLISFPDVSQMKRMSGRYSEIEWIKEERGREIGMLGDRMPEKQKETQIIKVSEKEWKELIAKLSQDFNNISSATNYLQPYNPANVDLPVGKFSPLRENENSYYIVALLSKSQNKIKVATIVWEKNSFDGWWEAKKTQFPSNIIEPSNNYYLPKILSDTCGQDSWTATNLTGAPSPRMLHTAVWTGAEMIIWGGAGSSSFNTGAKYDPGTNAWTATGTTNAPSARIYFTAVWTGTEMIVWGGYSGGIDVNTGGKYNPGSNTWIATNTTTAPAGRESHTAIWTGTEMIIWGGNGYFNTGGRYNPGADSWTATSTINAPAGRMYHSAVWTGAQMIIWGGWDGGFNLNSGGRYAPGTNTWIATSSTNVPDVREQHTAIWTGTDMVIWGGCNGTTSGCDSSLNTGAKYNPGSDLWAPISMGNAPSARYSHSAVWTGAEMIIWGGISSPDPGARYNPFVDSWTTTTTINAPAGREHHTAVWTGTEMIIWGGFIGGVGYTDTGGRYIPGAASWTPTTTINAPDERSDHTAVWTGAEMIIWGGDYWVSTAIYYNTGGRYSPGTDSWTPTNTTNAPSGRSHHTAVWTGVEMIVWGGWNPDYLNTGGKYSPATNTWTATITTNAPSARRWHRAIWTGTEMIVWGGENASGSLGAGARYNPDANSWLPTATNNEPEARMGHIAVWTGTEMIIWGGWNSPNYYNNGKRYNPVTDSWIDTNLANAPAARSFPSAVWTGTEMIIWGGYGNGPTLFNDGGRYNPIANSWTAITTVNAPDARSYHAALWTGSEMIIWGGYHSIMYSTGGQYSPGTDSWTNTTDMNAPEARQNHTAVWTGLEMIIWGGDNGTNFFNTGGSYCAVACSAPVFGGVQSVADVNNCQTTGIQITWQQPANWGNGATGGTYELRRYINPTCSASYATIASGLPASTVSYTDTSATPGINYFYQVVATNNCNPSTSTPGATACSPPVADNGFPPTGLTNNTAADLDACADTGVRITWNSDPGNWGDGGSGTRTYSVLRNGTVIASLAYGTTAFIDTTGTNNVSYTYNVRYNNGCGLSTVTVPGATAIDNVGSAPSGLTNNVAVDIDNCADTGVRITWIADPASWNDNGFGTRTYSILRGGISIVSGLAYGTTTFIDTTGTNNMSYTYTVRYTNGCNLSTATPGAQAADNVDATPCPDVANTLHIVKSGTNAVITWATLTCLDLANYRVYGSTSYNAPFPSGWIILGNPISASLSDPLASAYIAYKTLSVDFCGNISPN